MGKGTMFVSLLVSTAIYAYLAVKQPEKAAETIQQAMPGLELDPNKKHSVNDVTNAVRNKLENQNKAYENRLNSIMDE